MKCRRCLFFVFFVQAITTPDIGTPRFNQQFAHKGFFKIALRCFYTLTKLPANGWRTTKKLKNIGTAVEMPSLPLFCHFCSSNFATTPGIGTPRFNHSLHTNAFSQRLFQNFTTPFYPSTKLHANGWRTTANLHHRATTPKRPSFTTSHAILLLFYLYLSIL